MRTATIQVPLLPSSSSRSKTTSNAMPKSFNETNSLYQTLENHTRSSSITSSVTGMLEECSIYQTSLAATINPKELVSTSFNYTLFKEAAAGAISDELQFAEPISMFGYSHDAEDLKTPTFNCWNVPRTSDIDKMPVMDIFNFDSNNYTAPSVSKRSASMVAIKNEFETELIHERDSSRRKSDSILPVPLVQSNGSTNTPILCSNTTIKSEDEIPFTTFEFHFEKPNTAPLLEFLCNDGDVEEETEQEDGPSTPVPDEPHYKTPESSNKKNRNEKSDNLVLLLDPMSNHEKSTRSNYRAPSYTIVESDDDEDYSDAEYKPNFKAAPPLARPRYSRYSDGESDFESEDTSTDSDLRLTSLSKVQQEKALIEQVQIKVVPTTFTPPSTSSSSSSPTSSASFSLGTTKASVFAKAKTTVKPKRGKRASKLVKQNKQFRPLEPGEVYYPCPKCEQFFRRPEHVKRHIRSVHTHVRPYKCEFCDKGFPRSDNLSQHLKTHMSLEEWARLKDSSTGKAKLIKNIKKRIGGK